jgi:hypothetical protein
MEKYALFRLYFVILQLAKKAEGRIYTGWSEPSISEFNSDFE